MCEKIWKNAFWSNIYIYTRQDGWLFQQSVNGLTEKMTVFGAIYQYWLIEGFIGTC